MSKILDDVTIETFPEIVRQGGIKPGQRFSIVLDVSEATPKGLKDIAAKMRAAAVARGLTTEIFDDILAHPV